MADKQKNWFGRHKVLTVIFGLIILAIIGAAAGGSKTTSKTANTSTKTTSSTSSQPKTVGLNQAADDGKFEFTVASISCGQASVGQDQYLTKAAQGQYCLMNVSVKNIGSEAQTFDASNQFVFDAQNHKYSADSTASDYANPSGSTFLNDINPGNSVSGIVVFDIPKGVTPTVAEIHDSAFSGGVKVNLQ